MTKKVIIYRVLMTLITLLVITGGGLLYGSLNNKASIQSESTYSSVEAEELYGSTVHEITPDSGVVSLWDGTSSEMPEGAGDEYEPYLIASAANLNYVSQNPSTFNNKYLKQTVNIDLAGNPWTPIGSGVYKYDGNGKTIYNLCINSVSSDTYIGLFTYINPGSYLKNLNIVGATISLENSSSINSLGIFVGYCYGNSSASNTLSNLHATQVTISVNACSSIGGIVGNVYYTNIDNLSFDGNIYSEENTSQQVGGVIGNCSSVGALTNLSSFGNIFVKMADGSQGYTYAGGVVGQFSISGGEVVIENCVNYSNIQLSYCYIYAGGVFGNISGSDKTTYIAKYLINYGNLFAEGVGTTSCYCAGICGRVSKFTILSSANYGNIYAKNENITSYPNFNVGGIYGFGNTVDLSYCYNQGNILGQSASDVAGTVGGITGWTYNKTSINEVLSVGSVAKYYNDSGVGGVFGQIYTTTVTLDGAYFTSDTVTNAYWENAVVLSDTSRIAGTWGSGFSAVNYGAVTSSSIKPTQANVKPSALSSFDETYWDFSRVGEYPRLKNMPSATRLKAQLRNVKLIMDTVAATYNGTAQEKDLKPVAYELKGFENNDPTSYWDGKTSIQPNGKGTQNDPYLIESAANLAWVSANSQTATGAAYGKYYVQVANIDLNNFFWTPIGVYSTNSHPIYYDGNYHTIKNLYVDNTKSRAYYLGLFGYVKGGYIRNLGIESGKIVATQGYAGSIAGSVSGSNITNCYNKADFVSSGVSASIGGIVSNCSGSATNGQGLFGCWNDGNIFANKPFNDIGGIVGWNYCMLRYCVNTGNIYLGAMSSSSSHVGGIAAYEQGNLTGCVNYGNISALGNGTLANTYVGGIVGGRVPCYGCFNFGSLAGLIGYTSKVGGICGRLAFTSSNYGYYNSEMAGFNVTTQIYDMENGTLVSESTLGKTTSELMVVSEGTQPSGTNFNSTYLSYYNFFKNQYPSVKPAFGSMTLYQNEITENQTKPEISSWSGDYDLSVAPTLLNPSAENSETNPYIIDSANKLAYLSKYYNATTVNGKYFKQTVDIDLCGHNWTPINDACNTSYALYYNGDNHTIYNLKIEQTGISQNKQIGFIGILATGYIKNLTLNGGVVRVVGACSNTQHIGAFVGQVHSPSVENCHNIGVDVICDQLGCGRVGGLIGEGIWGAQILNCSNNGKVDLKYSNYGSAVGGICGCFYAQTSNGNEGNITNCTNYGSVSCVSTGGSQVGGIVGYTHVGRINITSCENYGNGYCYSGNECCVGGIVGNIGDVSGTSKTVVITKCFNAGNLRGNETTTNPNVGGIIGLLEGSTSAGLKTVSQSISVGSIATIPGNVVTFLGGIVGAIVGDQHTITNCYYNYQTVATGNWTDSTTYLSTAADSQYLYGARADGGSAINVSGSWPRSTADMQSSANNAAPTGINHIANNDANYSLVKGQYPRVKTTAEQNYSYDNTSTFMVSTTANQTTGEISVWNGSSWTQPTLKYTSVPNSEANPYIIDSANKLVWLSKNSATANGYYLKQTVDIDLNNRTWTPINNTTAAKFYYYDGDGHTIYNINVNQSMTSQNYAGLFGKLSTGSYIKNLTLNGGQVIATTTATSNSAIAGAFVGEIYGNASSIRGGVFNCHNINVLVSATAGGLTNTTYGACSGGIVGNLYHNNTIQDCSNSGDVFGAVVNSTVSYSQTGGIVGQSYFANSYIVNCKNYGNVTGNAAAYTYGGGIVGSGLFISVSQCENYGVISCYTPSGNKEPHAGGIAGVLSNCSLTYSANHGDVFCSEIGSTSPNAGGLVGGIYDNTRMQYCYSTGAVAYPSNQGWGFLGGVVGLVNDGSNTISNCYYDYQKVNQGSFGTGISYLPSGADIGYLYGNTPGSTNTVSSCSGLTTQEMQGSTTSMAGFDSGVWEFSANDYPRLKSVNSRVSVWDGSASVKPTGVGSETNPYIIASAANLKYLSAHYSDSDIAGKYFKQVVDIDLANHDWSPINSGWSGRDRVYHYDGGNHTIYNLYMNYTNITTDLYIGLFGIVGGDSYIKNLTLSAGSVNLSGSRWALAGAFLGNTTNTAGSNVVLENLHNKGVRVTATSTTTTSNYWTIVGGIAAACIGTIKNCSCSTDLIISNPSNTTALVGGIVGGANQGMIKIENCVNYGNITVTLTTAGGVNIGGILGYQPCPNDGQSYIKNSLNMGDITVVSSSSVCVGGIAGTFSNLSVSNCENNGNIVGRTTATRAAIQVGGLIGQIAPTNDTATNVYTMSNLANHGNVYGSSNYMQQVGGITGRTHARWGVTLNYENCYFTGYGAVGNGESNGGTLEMANRPGAFGFIYAYATEDGYGENAINVTNFYYNSSIINNYVSDYPNATTIIASAGFNGSSSSALTTQQMSVTTSGTAPTKMTGFTNENWDFIVGGYPQLRNLPSNTSSNISYWDGTSSEVPVNGDGSALNPYQISSGANLKWLSDNSGSLSGKYFIQTADINLGNHNWTPISNESQARVFYYDGKGHTIYNLYVYRRAENSPVANVYGGLFGYVKCGYIKNLTLNKGTIDIKSTSGTTRAGAFVGAQPDVPGDWLYLDNLHNIDVDVITSTGSTAEWGSAGIIQYVGYGQITNCSNTGRMLMNEVAQRNGDWCSGGIVGQLKGLGSRIANCVNYGKINVISSGQTVEKLLLIGGISGWTGYENGKIVENCVNYGEISVSGNITYEAGGIVGRSRKFLTMKNCVNYANITAIDTDSPTSYTHSVGGLIARIADNNKSVYVDNCANYGDLYNATMGTSASYSLLTGGLYAVSYGAYTTNCCNYGNIYSYFPGTTNTESAGGLICDTLGAGNDLTNCFSTGAVMAYRNTTSLTGGLIGITEVTSGNNITNCYYNTSTISSGTVPWGGTSYSPTRWGGTKLGSSTLVENCFTIKTNVSGLTTAQMQSTLNGTCPSGMVGFTQENWNFVKGNYPSLGLLACQKLYSDNINAGTATASVALGKGSGYVGVLSNTFTIGKATNVWTLSPQYSNTTYLDNPSTLIAMARFGTVTATFKNSGGTTVTMTATSNAGTYTVVVSVAGTNNYTSLQTTITFTISPRDITNNSNVNVGLNQTDYTYDGTPKTPTETVTYG